MQTTSNLAALSQLSSSPRVIGCPMPNYGYHLARAKGNAARAIYRVFLPLIARRHISTRAEVPCNVVTYSGERSLPEQVASIRSFLKHVGRPRRFTIVSDGTLSGRSS